ncbi:MAG: MBL fold metallo-hydrolase [Gammaproteobacteria bacterium]|nr:MBL fold metallo-hydrolase [Gammaproteobacteria bacterium]
MTPEHTIQRTGDESINLRRRALLPAVAFGMFAPAMFVRAAQGDDIRSDDFADGLTVFSGAGGNVVVHEGPDSIVLIDGGAPEYSAALLTAVAERFGGKPVAGLVNTHWHLAQTGANDVLGARAVPIIAHENTRRWMSTRIEQHWGGPIIEPRAEIARPTRTFYLNDELAHGGSTIALIHTPRAHTDGDVHAVFADANVIVAGGIAYPRIYPVLDTATNGWIGEMLDATRTLLARVDGDTVVVPADGRMVTREDLQAQEQMLATIFDRFQKFSREGKGADDMLAEGIADEYVKDFGDPTEFITTAWDGLSDHMRGLRAF